MFGFGVAVGFFSGGVLVWFSKDKLQAWYQGAAKFAANLEAKAAALKAAIK